MKRQRSEADVHRAADGSDLVTFNVSGKIYTVLREPTLSLHPNSLLTQLAEEKGNEKEIFVEGDQDLFKYVLEYHRDRKILLPPMISKEAVLREVKRFGLDLAPEETPGDGVCLPSVVGHLPPGRTVFVQELRNDRAFIREPVEGWVPLRSPSGQVVLAQQAPAVSEPRIEAREDLRPAWEDLHPVPGSLHVKRSSMPELRRGKGSSNLARDWEEWLQQARERQKGGRLEGREVEKRIEVEPETLEKKDEKSILEATPGTLERRAASGISGKEEKSLGEAVPGTLERKTVPGMEKEKALAEAAPGTLEQEETIVAEAVPDTLENEEVKEGEGDQERLEQQEQSVVEALPAAEKQDEIKKTQTFEEEELLAHKQFLGIQSQKPREAEPAELPKERPEITEHPKARQ
eukprot:g15554.t1